MGSRGTKVIIYNLWCNDDGNLELDFDTDSKVVFVILLVLFLCALFYFYNLALLLIRGTSYMQDIRIAGDVKRIDTLKAWKSVNEDHIANRFRYSLHVCMI